MNEQSKQTSSTSIKPYPKVYTEDSDGTVKQIYIQVIQPKKSKKKKN